MLIAHKVALEAVAALRPLVGPIRREDKALADQIRRAASSMVLNIAEAEYSDAGNSRARLHTAAGSANETVAALEVAMAWRYIDEHAAQVVLALLDRVKALLWRLNHRR